MFQEKEIAYTEVPIAGAYIVRSSSGHFYIGSTSDVYSRRKNHESQLRKGIHPNPKMLSLFKEGATFTWEYYLTNTREEAYQAEQEILNANKEDPKLLNVALDVKASRKGLAMSEDAKRKLSEFRTGMKLSPEHVAKVAKANTGKKRTPEQRQRFSESKKNIPKSPDQRARLLAMCHARMRKVEIDGVVYSGVPEASEKLGIKTVTIHSRIRNSNFPNWKYFEETRLVSDTH